MFYNYVIRKGVSNCAAVYRGQICVRKYLPLSGSIHQNVILWKSGREELHILWYRYIILRKNISRSLFILFSYKKKDYLTSLDMHCIMSQ